MTNIAPTRGATVAQAALIATALQASDTITRTIITRYGTTAERVAVTPQAGEMVLDTDLNAIYRGDGSTPGGISVTPNFNTSGTLVIGPSAGTAILSGDLVRAGYAAAKALTPYGNALGAQNRARLILMPGRYDIGGGASGLTVDTEYVDISGLTQNPLDVVIAVAPGSAKIITQTANDCRLSNFHLYSSDGSNNAQMAMQNAAGHALTEHSNLYYSGGGTTAAACHSYSGLTNLGGTYRRCRSTQTKMYGGLTAGWTCNAVFEDCEAYTGSLGACNANTDAPVLFTGRHTRCRLLPGVSNTAYIALTNGALIAHGWYKSTTSAQRIFKVTGATTPGPFVAYNMILSATGFALDRVGSETNGVLFATHNRMGASGVSTNLTNGAGTAANAFNIENAAIAG